jgi:Uma2 family endonuclease
MAIAIQSTPPPRPAADLHRITVDQYHRMIASGVLTKEDRCELIHGLLVEKPRINPHHAVVVSRLTRWFVTALGAAFVVRVQLPITLSDSEPEPDLVLAAGQDGDYVGHHPEPRDILLLIEVSDSSLADDQGTKLRLYAREKVGQYWIVNLRDRVVEVYTDPRGGKKPTYRVRVEYRPGQRVPVTVGGRGIGDIPASEILP